MASNNTYPSTAVRSVSLNGMAVWHLAWIGFGNVTQGIPAVGEIAWGGSGTLSCRCVSLSLLGYARTGHQSQFSSECCLRESPRHVYSLSTVCVRVQISCQPMI